MTQNPMHRRDFIKKSALTVGAAGLLSSTGINALFASDKHARKLGVALVGLGNYSETMLGPALKETSNCFLSGIVTGTPAKAARWQREYELKDSNIYSYDNYDDIANNDDIDIIYVVLPNSMHAEYTIRALEAGKHVICEKPMALTAEECQRMIDVSDKTGKKLAVGYRMHYDPYFIDVKRLAHTKAFGEINYLEASLGYAYRPNPNSWKMKKAMGGGSLYNLGVYPIQGARHSMGSEPLYVTAQASTKRKDLYTEIDEMFTWQLEWADGTLCSSYTGPNARVDRLYIGCTNGWINNEPAYGYSGQAVDTSRGPMNHPQVFQQRIQIEDFARCVIEDEESIVNGWDGMQDIKIIDAIHKSIETGKKVRI